MNARDLHRRGAALIVVWAASAFAIDAAAALTAIVEPHTISESDTLELLVRSTDAGEDTPDWTPVTRDFDILATRSATQIRSINGNVESERSWVLRLKPRRTGELEIPALELAGERSRAQKVTVKPLDPGVRRAIDDLVFFEVTHTPSPVYVRGQLTLKRRLYYADGAQLYGELPETPRVENAVVHPLGEPVASSESRNGRRYGVLEQGFAIFPERSGSLRIPAATVSGSVSVAMSPGAVPRRTGVQVSSKEVVVDVLPVPTEYPSDQPWLPASRVEIVEAWEREPPTLKVGEPLTRTLIVRVEGNDASIIPPLVMGTIAAKAYPVPADQNDTPTPKGMIGTRTEAITLVATAPGALTLPAVTLTWWDTRAKRVERAEVPARTLYAEPSPGGSLPALPREEETSAPTEQSPAAASAGEAVVPTAPPSSASSWWLLLLAATTLISTAGWIATWWRTRSRTPAQSTPVDPKRAEHVAFDALRRACRSREPVQIRRALTEWLREFTAKPTHGGGTRASPLADPHLRTLVGNLDRMLYGPTPDNAAFDAEPLLRRVIELRNVEPPRAADASLPPLYLSGRTS